MTRIYMKKALSDACIKHLAGPRIFCFGVSALTWLGLLQPKPESSRQQGNACVVPAFAIPHFGWVGGASPASSPVVSFLAGGEAHFEHLSVVSGAA